MSIVSPVGAGEEGVRDPGTRRPRDHVPGPDRDVLAALTGSSRTRRRPELEHALSFEDHEHLFLLGVAVRHRAALPARPAPSAAGLLRALRCRERRRSSSSRCASSSTSSTLRMLSGLGDGSPCSSGAACGLGVPGIVVTALDPRPPDPDRARARKPADLCRVTRAEDEVLEPIGPGDEGVLVLVRAVDDAVARHAPRAPARPATRAPSPRARSTAPRTRRASAAASAACLARLGRD